MRNSPEFVTFQEEGHQYFNEKLENYISCTTIIGNYKRPYDNEYWSLYKAIERVVEQSGESFDEYKKFCGNYKNVNAVWGANPFKTKEVYQAQIDIKEEWRLNSEGACERGTLEHDSRERNILEYRTMRGTFAGTEMDVVQDPQSKKNTIMNFIPTNRVYTEALVWNDQYRVAGQVDYVEQEGIYLDIKDYKTNKDKIKKGKVVPGIPMTSYLDERMLHPMSEVPDCKWFHYQLQMSLYGWMAEQEGYKVRSLELIWIRPDGDKYMPTEYRPDLVEIMLGHYAKTNRYIS